MKKEFARRLRGARYAHPAASAMLLAILSAFANHAAAQAAASTGASDMALKAAANLNYVGSRSRLGVGYDHDTKARGEFSHVLSESALSAFIAQGWISRRSGGVRADYNWISGIDGKPAPDSLVRKLFGALDRNQDGDRKLTAGFGLESENWFGNLSYSHGLSGKRYVEEPSTTTETRQETGIDAGRPFVDSITTTTSTRLFERAYEHGIGVRGGHFYSAALLQLALGYDREWGKFSSHQNTFSLDIEKYFSGSPHSLALHVERYNKSGDYETRSNDTRVQIMYRYSFGATKYGDGDGFRRTRVAQQVPVEMPATQPPAAPSPPRQQPPCRLPRKSAWSRPPRR